jgi:hypothetical protein
MFDWLKSVRAFSAVIFVVSINVALFLRILPVEQYITIAMLVVGAYFAKRDTPEDRGE